MAVAEAVMNVPETQNEGVGDSGETKQEPDPREQFQMHLLGMLTGALTSGLIALGDSLGIYATMAAKGKATSAELAEASGLNERFLREWLYQQAAAGIVSATEDATSFWLTDVQTDCLVNEHGKDASPYFSAGAFPSVPGFLSKMDRLAEAFKTGRGFTYDDMGADSICGISRFLAVWVRHFLVDGLCTLPGMKQKLVEGIKVADVGCGTGEVIFVLAKAFPKCTFHGYDISAKSLQTANQRKEKEGLGMDIRFLNPAEGGGLPDEPTYDLVITMDAVHDMARPDKVLALVRKALKPEGAYLVNDPRGAPTPAGNIAGNPVAPLFYGFSCHACLPSGLSEPGGMGLGTLGFQEEQARKIASAAGFKDLEVVTSFESPMNNVFLLKP